MNEIDRLRYLHAMGVDAYVSRGQLPGAAPSKRLLLVAAPGHQATPAAPEPAARPAATPQLDVVKDKPAPRPAPARAQTLAPTVRFRLAAVFCGGIAWVESLGDRPLAREQVQLIQGMARAVHGSADTPKVAQFDWPIHNNPQLDQGEAAARAGVLAFLQRHIEEQKCRGLVILGEDAAAYVDAGGLGALPRVATLSTLQMLEQPAGKRQVWADLQPLVLRA
ncbi:hypothetical protein DWB85_11820 [Seongchinamella sediminis]|uniref:Uncharacterized protein n=1 Tax=Seongchinamella sediminis TaxID=2283635 RepID=A0A3L7DWK4_9GAMM|nr:hypothetical protein [Seongchinamella sediminis]RLQ21694.1 hypothetical protein DWB85_11820 [Seongchinamella sediminis]